MDFTKSIPAVNNCSIFTRPINIYTLIEKTNFRDQVRQLLLKKMRSGHLKPENPLSLASLARDLNVSVTPIREALSQLQSSGIVEAIPNRGFFIPKLSMKEAINLYELVASLESLAILNSTFTKDKIKALKELNKTFVNTENKIERINADMDFHDALTSSYENPIALKILSELKTRIFFYELEFMSQENYYSNSSSEHSMIIEHLENDSLDQACIILS